MGLDMYLRAEKYVSGYDFKASEKEVFDKVITAVGADGFTTADSLGMTVSITVMYWRKANAIHNWFVQNVQEGEDECKPHYVGREDLIALRDTCQKVLDNPTLASELLPTTAGFFFGGVEYDDYYWSELSDTIKGINKILGMSDSPLTGWSFEYQSSW